jgi:putative hemolysin
MMLAHFLILIALILVNGLFAMAELSLFSSRATRLRQIAQEGSRGARAALRLLDQPTRFLSTVQFYITLICVLAGYAFGNVPFVKKRFELVIVAIVIVSVLPMVIEVWRARRQHKPSTASP